ncbi:MAG TPA: NADH-quinone oxidoreductase subunit G [Marmoricola sp.]|nr:NADH-quinone oxidoreductase subunit G [Marmoricola sp.]
MTAAEVETLVTLTIDGVEVSVPPGTLVIRAAEQAGVMIPRFCDHPLLDPVGACRQCLVDVPDAGNGRGFPKPQASCTIEVAPGMLVNTQATSPVAAKAQAGIMEFLLVNHPLDCPVCDKGGECPLQNQAMSNGRSDSRFSDPQSGNGQKRLYPKPIALSPQVLLDRERCVLCARCTRFSEEISGDPLIALVERGALQQVGRYEDEPYFSYFSGNVIQICPVGALTSADYRFRSRPFDLVSSPSISEHDASGAAIRVDHRRGKVMRRLSGNDPEVNEEWITDKDRFAFAYEHLNDRLTHPLIREDGELRPASWAEAFAFAAQGLCGGAAAVLPGGRLTLEDAYAYSKFARVVLDTNDIDFRARRQTEEEAQFLATFAATRGISYADVDNAKSVLLVALEPEDEAGTLFLRLRKAALKKKLPIAAIAAHMTPGLRKLKATLIPAAPGAEVDELKRVPDLSAESVILVGERAAEVPGLLSAVAALSTSTGARLAWIPRRAGDRGALDAGALPGLLPGGRPIAEGGDLGWGPIPSKPGRDLDAIIAAAAKGEIKGLVVGGVDPADLPDPAAAISALRKAFVVSLELRESAVTEVADVVFPIAPVSQRAGSYVNWEGRSRSFEAVMPGMNPTAAVSDTRILAGIAEELDKPLGFRTSAQAGAEFASIGTWSGTRPAAPSATTGSVQEGLVLSSWKQLIDDGRMQDGADELRSCARPARAVVASSLASALGISNGDLITVSGPLGELDLPIEVGDIIDSVVWAPASSPEASVRTEIGPAGSHITVRAALKQTEGGK